MGVGGWGEGWPLRNMRDVCGLVSVHDTDGRRNELMNALILTSYIQTCIHVDIYIHTQVLDSHVLLYIQIYIHTYIHA